jgi:hypothetical protein
MFAGVVFMRHIQADEREESGHRRVIDPDSDVQTRRPVPLKSGNCRANDPCLGGKMLADFTACPALCLVRCLDFSLDFSSDLSFIPSSLHARP